MAAARARVVITNQSSIMATKLPVGGIASGDDGSFRVGADDGASLSDATVQPGDAVRHNRIATAKALVVAERCHDAPEPAVRAGRSIAVRAAVRGPRASERS